jgi:hypothetical protein
VRLFGILNFGHWNLFVIWFLELGILVVLINSVYHLHSGLYPVESQGPGVNIILWDDTFDVDL